MTRPGRLGSITSIADDTYIAFQMSSAKHAAINIYELLLLSTRFAPHQQLSRQAALYRRESSLR